MIVCIQAATRSRAWYQASDICSKRAHRVRVQYQTEDEGTTHACATSDWNTRTTRACAISDVRHRNRASLCNNIYNLKRLTQITWRALAVPGLNSLWGLCNITWRCCNIDVEMANIGLPILALDPALTWCKLRTLHQHRAPWRLPAVSVLFNTGHA